jgi:hypothetical protein
MIGFSPEIRVDWARDLTLGFSGHGVPSRFIHGIEAPAMSAAASSSPPRASRARINQNYSA